MAGFVDPLDEEADAEGASSVGKHKDKLAERMRSAAEPNEVEVQEPEDDEDEEKEELAEAKVSRRDKRAARRSVGERAAAAEARAQVLQEQLEIARRSAPERQEARSAGNPVAEIDARYKQVNEKLAALHDEWNRGKLTAARTKEIQDLAESLDLEKTTIAIERREALMAPQRQRAEAAAQLRARAPDVYANAAALQYAQGEFQKRVARGEADSLDTFDAAMNEAREVVLGKRPKPDAITKQRAAGIASGPRAPSSGEDRPKLSMVKGSPLYKLACARYPDLEPAEACQKWANKNGKAYLERTRG